MPHPNLSAPSISVILSAMQSFSSLEHTIAKLWNQTIRDEIELVLVGPSQPEPSWMSEARRRFYGIQIVHADPFVSIGESNARGVRHALADIVALAEDHSFPEPDWAAALVRAHRDGWDAVGPQVLNANPTSVVSCADFLIGYSPWAAPRHSGEVAILPGHNRSYKKAALMAYGDRMAGWLQAETVLHYDMARSGKKLYLEAQARTAHVNFSRFRTWFTIQGMQGRVFAAQRCKDWSFLRRLLFAAASPLIPSVRLVRITREYFSAQRSTASFLSTLPCLAFGLVVDGVGQFVGYAFGDGNTIDRIAILELQRIDHITALDRKMLFPPNPLDAAILEARG